MSNLWEQLNALKGKAKGKGGGLSGKAGKGKGQLSEVDYSNDGNYFEHDNCHDLLIASAILPMNLQRFQLSMLKVPKT